MMIISVCAQKILISKMVGAKQLDAWEAKHGMDKDVLAQMDTTSMELFVSYV